MTFDSLIIGAAVAGLAAARALHAAGTDVALLEARERKLRAIDMTGEHWIAQKRQAAAKRRVLARPRSGVQSHRSEQT